MILLCVCCFLDLSCFRCFEWFVIDFVFLFTSHWFVANVVWLAVHLLSIFCCICLMCFWCFQSILDVLLMFVDGFLICVWFVSCCWVYVSVFECVCIEHSFWLLGVWHVLLGERFWDYQVKVFAGMGKTVLVGVW